MTIPVSTTVAADTRQVAAAAIASRIGAGVLLLFEDGDEGRRVEDHQVGSPFSS
jgi:hypothetical protein